MLNNLAQNQVVSIGGDFKITAATILQLKYKRGGQMCTLVLDESEGALLSMDSWGGPLVLFFADSMPGRPFGSISGRPAPIGDTGALIKTHIPAFNAGDRMQRGRVMIGPNFMLAMVDVVVESIVGRQASFWKAGYGKGHEFTIVVGEADALSNNERDGWLALMSHDPGSDPHGLLHTAWYGSLLPNLQLLVQ